MLTAPRCLTVKPGQAIRIETDAGEIVLNVISAADDSLRVEVFPAHVESVEIRAATSCRSKALTSGNAWLHHKSKGGALCQD